MVRALINVPKKAHRGEVVEIKLLISHPMESGQRRDEMGKTIPRDIIHSFRCTYNDVLVLEADWFPAIAANPFLSFSLMAEESGKVIMSWTDDHGVVQTESAAIEVA